jgi:hypothetical protein
MHPAEPRPVLRGPPGAFRARAAHGRRVAVALAQPARELLDARIAELDNGPELDTGNPAELGEQYRALSSVLPHLAVAGGC